MSKLSCPVFLSVLMLHVFGAFGQTLVGGGITGNTTWSKAGSPYVVTENVVIYPGIELTIEAGVEVRFYSGTGLEFRDAQAVLQGSVQESIYFRLESDDPENITVDDYWSGITFKSSTGAFVDRSLAYLEFEHAREAVAFQNEPGYKYVRHCQFENNLIAISNGSQNITWLEVDDSHFISNGKAITGRMNVSNSSFVANDLAIADPLFFQNENSGGHFVNCLFEGNDVAMGFDNFQVNFAELKHCQFINNTRAINLYQVRADSSLFQGSTDIAISFDKGWLRNSLVVENQIGVLLSSYGFFPELLGNTIRDNQVGIQVFSPEVYIIANRICHNLQYNLQLSTSETTSITDNCWCTEVSEDIANKIWDSSDAEWLGQAIVNPIMPGCGSGQFVYPGDSELDNGCGITDVLWMGWAYGSTGPIRTDLGISWAGHNGADWSQTFADGRNYKHADADGNGIVEEIDLLAVEQNHGLTNDLSGMGAMQLIAPGGAGQLELDLPDVLYTNQSITVPVLLGTEDLPLTLHGLAFQITLPEDLIDLSTVVFSADTSWLGDDLLTLDVQNDATIDIAISRKDQFPTTGWGQVGTLSFILSEDIVGQQDGGSQATEELEADFEIMITPLLGLVDDLYKIDLYGNITQSVLTDISDIEVNEEGKLVCAPNPVGDRINLYFDELTSVGDYFLIWDVNGRLINRGDLSYTTEISSTGWKPGVYQLQIMSADGQLKYRTSLIKQ